MPDVPKKVVVTFNLNGMGVVKETYDMFDVNDLAVWRANASAYMQISVKEISTVFVEDHRVKALERLRRLNRFRAKNMRLSLAKSQTKL